MSTLNDKLREFKSTFDKETPTDLLETISRSISLLEDDGVVDKSIQLGETLPSFTLPDTNGSLVSSETLLKDRPLIITFIRGGWCPYCMLEIQEWQKRSSSVVGGINIVAVTPEITTYAAQTKDDNNLDFPLLIDEGCQYTEKLGLGWQLDDDIKDMLLRWNVDLVERNSDHRFYLPIPATFVVATDGSIRYRFVEEDYTQRAEPSEVMNHYYDLLS